MKRLLFVALPRVEESPRSVLQRTVTGNGCTSIKQLEHWLGLRAAGQTLGHVTGESKLVAALADEAGESREPFMTSFFSKTGGFTLRQPVKVTAANVPPDWLRGKERSVCPACIAEGWSKAVHDLNFVHACPYHQVALISHCPQCDVPLNWIASRFDRCGKCHARLKNAELCATDASGVTRVLHYLRTAENTRLRAVVEALKLMQFDRLEDRDERNSALNLAVAVVEGDPMALKKVLEDGLARTPGLPLSAIATPWLVSKHACLRQNMLSILGEVKAPRAHRHSATCRCDDETFSSTEVGFFLKVSSSTVRQLVEAQLLTRRPGPGPRQWLYDRFAVCRLVGTLTPSDAPAVGESLVPRGVGSGILHERILAIKAGRIKVVSVDWFRGLSAVRTVAVPRKRSLPPNAVSVTDAAKRLGTYADAVRRAVKANRLAAFSTAATSTTVWIREADLDAFDRDFVFLTKLATEVGGGRTILSTKLEHVGVWPVSGLRVDGGLVPIYRRADLAHIDLREVAAIKQFEARSGRKKDDPDTYDSQDWMSSQETAMLLKLTAQQLSPLVREGLLEVGVPPGREADNRRYYRRESVLRTERWIADALEVNRFVATVGLTRREFHVRFTRGRRVTLIQVGAVKMIGAEDIKLVRQDVAQYVTCEQAGRAFGAPTKHFSNLVRTGRFSADKSHPLGDGKSLIVLRRSDVEAYADSVANPPREVVHP